MSRCLTTDVDRSYNIHSEILKHVSQIILCNTDRPIHFRLTIFYSESNHITFSNDNTIGAKEPLPK